MLSAEREGGEQCQQGEGSGKREKCLKGSIWNALPGGAHLLSYHRAFFRASGQNSKTVYCWRILYNEWGVCPVGRNEDATLGGRVPGVGKILSSASYFDVTVYYAVKF